MAGTQSVHADDVRLLGIPRCKANSFNHLSQSRIGFHQISLTPLLGRIHTSRSGEKRARSEAKRGFPSFLPFPHPTTRRLVHHTSVVRVLPRTFKGITDLLLAPAYACFMIRNACGPIKEACFPTRRKHPPQTLLNTQNNLSQPP